MEKPRTEKTAEELAKEFPGVEHAYPLAIESYKTVRERFDLMEKRGQTLIVFVTTIAAFIVTLSTKQGVPRVTVFLILGFSFYAVSMAFAIATQTYGKFIIPSPKLLREKTLTWDAWTFKNHLIDWAGSHFDQNMKVVNARMQMILGTILFGLLSLVSLALWATGL